MMVEGRERNFKIGNWKGVKKIRRKNERDKGMAKRENKWETVDWRHLNSENVGSGNPQI